MAGETVRRKAIAPAFYEGRRVRAGETVSVPADFKASWLSEPIAEPKKPVDEQKSKG